MRLIRVQLSANTDHVVGVDGNVVDEAEFVDVDGDLRGQRFVESTSTIFDTEVDVADPVRVASGASIVRVDLTASRRPGPAAPGQRLRWVVTPAPTVSPRRHGAQQQQHEHNEQNGSYGFSLMKSSLGENDASILDGSTGATPRPRRWVRTTSGSATPWRCATSSVRARSGTPAPRWAL